MSFKTVETYQKNIPIITISLATTSLLLGFGWTTQWLGMLCTLVAGIVWLLAYNRAWHRLHSLLFVAFVGLAGVGMWFGEATYVMFIGVILALIAWDWTHFQNNIEQASNIDNLEAVLEEKVRRLAIVVGSSLLLGILALSLRFNFNFNWILFLGLIVIIGLGSTLRALRNQ